MLSLHSFVICKVLSVLDISKMLFSWIIFAQAFLYVLQYHAMFSMCSRSSDCVEPVAAMLVQSDYYFYFSYIFLRFLLSYYLSTVRSGCLLAGPSLEAAYSNPLHVLLMYDFRTRGNISVQMYLGSDSIVCSFLTLPCHGQVCSNSSDLCWTE
jgi:hypothetical protein